MKTTPGKTSPRPDASSEKLKQDIMAEVNRELNEQLQAMSDDHKAEIAELKQQVLEVASAVQAVDVRLGLTSQSEQPASVGGRPGSPTSVGDVSRHSASPIQVNR